MKIKFKIATLEKVIYEDEIDQVSLPTKQGEITVLPHHIPLVTVLVPGEVIIKKDNQTVPMVISGGFLELADNQLTLLADTAERADEIDLERAEQARQRVKDLLETKQDKEEVDFTSLAGKMEKELARIRVAKKYKDVGQKANIKIEADKE